MSEKQINGTRVLFRDTIPAKIGWQLILPMNSLASATQAKRDEVLTRATKDVPDDVPVITAGDMVEIVNMSLGWDDVVLLVRGSVSEWDFDGDLTQDDCCDNLDTFTELIPIISEARAIFWGIDLSAKAGGESTSG